MKKQNATCRDIQDMIAWGKIERLTATDRDQIRRHMEKCPRCAVYAETLELIESAVLAEQALDADAAAGVKQDILAHFAENRSGKTGYLNWIREKLTWRIPVYQAAFVAILMFVIAFTVTSGADEKGPEDTTPQIVASMALLDTIQAGQLDNIGRSSLEDSTLIRIAVTAM